MTLMISNYHGECSPDLTLKACRTTDLPIKIENDRKGLGLLLIIILIGYSHERRISQENQGISLFKG